MVGVADGKARFLYLDGERVDSNPQQSNNAQWHTERLIGRRAAPATSFKGLMDEVMVFNRALSQAEVKALYGLQK